MIRFTALHPRAHDLVGFIPNFLSESDPRSAKEQFNQNYAHGGGWSPIKGFGMDKYNRLIYPGDPPIQPIAIGYLRDEFILIYHYSWVAIVQANGTFEVGRMG